MIGTDVGIGAACSAGALIAWLRELHAPRRIAWRPTRANGVSATVADGLVLQHDDGDTVWATRGFAIYRSRSGGPFERVLSLRPRFGMAWGGYLASLRSRFGYQELVELLPVGEERLVLFAAGDVYFVDLRARVVSRTHSLRYFGPGKGRGVMAFGLTRDQTGAVFFGEYATGPEAARPVCIWRSRDDGRTWHKAYEFPAGKIRHIHAVQFDPYGGTIWVGTGDRNDQCYVGVSHDGATSFRWVAQGSQDCRTCGFVFFPDAVLWGMDADHKPNHVIRLQRDEPTIRPHAELPAVTFYHRRLDESRALLGLARTVAEVWVANAEGDACHWLSFTVPARGRRGPAPGVRLGRGGAEGGADGFVHVNPIRTLEHEAAIFRIPTSAVPHPAAAAELRRVEMR